MVFEAVALGVVGLYVDAQNRFAADVYGSYLHEADGVRRQPWGNGRLSAIIGLLSTTLTIIYEKGEDGFWVATIPEVPGAFSQGKTKEEARENVIEATKELMAARRELALRERIKGATYETLSFQS